RGHVLIHHDMVDIWCHHIAAGLARRVGVAPLENLHNRGRQVDRVDPHTEELSMCRSGYVDHFAVSRGGDPAGYGCVVHGEWDWQSNCNPTGSPASKNSNDCSVGRWDTS